METGQPPLQLLGAVRHESSAATDGGSKMTGLEFLNIKRSERLQIVGYLLSNTGK